MQNDHRLSQAQGREAHPPYMSTSLFSVIAPPVMCCMRTARHNKVNRVSCIFASVPFQQIASRRKHFIQCTWNWGEAKGMQLTLCWVAVPRKGLSSCQAAATEACQASPPATLHVQAAARVTQCARPTCSSRRTTSMSGTCCDFRMYVCTQRAQGDTVISLVTQVAKQGILGL